MLISQTLLLCTMADRAHFSGTQPNEIGRLSVSNEVNLLCARSLFKIRPGPVWIWALSYASSVPASTETWGLTCHGFALWRWMICHESWRWFSVLSATTWSTVYGRHAQWATVNQHPMLHGKDKSSLNIYIYTQVFFFYSMDTWAVQLFLWVHWKVQCCHLSAVNADDSLVSLSLSREERESWIRAKYEQKLFVAPLPPPTSEGPDITLSGRLLLAVMEHNLPKLLLLLAHCTKEDINAPLSLARSSRSLLALRLPASPLHAACQQADVVMTQLLIWVCFPLSLFFLSYTGPATKQVFSKIYRDVAAVEVLG